MELPAKKYERLTQLQKMWGMSWEDVYYSIENGLLKTAIWLPLRYIERGTFNQNKFVWEEGHEPHKGFAGIRAEDCHKITGHGRARLHIFDSVTEERYLLRLTSEPPQPAISVSVHDLLVLQSAREQFEAQYKIAGNDDEELQDITFHHSNRYRSIVLRGKEYQLGDVQARVIEILHDAAKSRDPWVHGKTLIYESGSRAVRFRLDIFKHRKDWREIIRSDKNGYYRLNIPLDHEVDTPAEVE